MPFGLQHGPRCARAATWPIYIELTVTTSILPRLHPVCLGQITLQRGSALFLIDRHVSCAMDWILWVDDLTDDLTDRTACSVTEPTKPALQKHHLTNSLGQALSSRSYRLQGNSFTMTDAVTIWSVNCKLPINAFGGTLTKRFQRMVKGL